MMFVALTMERRGRRPLQWIHVNSSVKALAHNVSPYNLTPIKTNNLYTHTLKNTLIANNYKKTIDK